MPRKPPYIVFTQPLPTKGQYKVYSVATSESLGMIKGDNSKRYWEAFDNDGKFLQSAERKKQLMDFFREIDKKSRMAEGGGVDAKIEMKLYKIDSLSTKNKKVLTDREDNMYIYENGVLYDTLDGTKKGSSHRMSKINLRIVPFTEYGQGGGIGFEKLSNKVAKNYEGKKVAPKYQHEYGKTYSKLEAREVGDKVAGKVYWQQQGRKFGNGGGIEDTHMRISKAIFLAYGNIDEALEFKDYYPTSGVAPYRLVLSAVQRGWITPEEINKDVLNSAYETSSETEDAEEIGSSDMNHYVWSMLRDAGFDMKVENGRYIRVDKMAKGGEVGKIGVTYFIGTPEVQKIGRFNTRLAVWETCVVDENGNKRYGGRSIKFSSGSAKNLKLDGIKITKKEFDKLVFDKKLAKGGSILNEYEQEEFEKWKEDGNVSKNADGSYSTQDAGFRNRLKNLTELKKYFKKEFFSDSYYANGGSVEDYRAKAIERQRKEEEGKTFAPFRAFVYEGSDQFDDFKTDDFHKAVKWAKETLEAQRTYRKNSENLWAIVDEFTPIEKRNNVIYAYSEVARFGEEDTKKMKFKNGGNTTFYHDQAKKTLGEHLYNHIASLNKEQLEKHLSHLQKEIERMKANDTEFTKQEFLPKYKQEEKFILYLLERLDEFKYADGGNVEEDQEYYRVFRNNAGKDVAVKILKNPIFGKYDYYVDGSLRGQFDTFAQARQEVNYENFDMYKDGGNIYSKEESLQIARTILQQMGGQNRLVAFTGAYGFAYADGDVSFRIKNRKVNYVKVKLNGKDLYDVTFGRVSGTNFKVVEQLDDVYAEDLIDIFEKSTGMYLRFEKGGKMARGGGIEKKNDKWKKFVLDNKSWFDDESEDDEYNEILLTTRKNGDVGNEEWGREDVNEAKQIVKKIISKFPTTQYKIEQVDEYVYLYLKPSKSEREIQEEKEKEKKQTAKLSYEEQIINELGYSKEKTAKVVENLSNYPKEYYEKYKDRKNDYNNAFRVLYTSKQEFNNVKFSNLKEVVDYITNPSFGNGLFSKANPIIEVVISLYGWDCIRIKYNTDGFPYNEDGETNYTASRGKTLSIYPFITANIGSSKDLIDSLNKGISDFIKCYEIVVLEDKNKYATGGGIGNEKKKDIISFDYQTRTFQGDKEPLEDIIRKTFNIERRFPPILNFDKSAMELEFTEYVSEDELKSEQYKTDLFKKVQAVKSKIEGLYNLSVNYYTNDAESWNNFENSLVITVGEKKNYDGDNTFFAKGGGIEDEDFMSQARTSARESIDWEEELRNYAGDNYKSLTAKEKEEIIAEMKANYDYNFSYAKGGLVVTSIKDIPNFKEENEAGRITYRGLGMGKLSNDFYKIAGEGGTRIKVKGKEYYITDTEFNTFSRDSSGKMRIKFDAPYRRSFATGGNFDSEFYAVGGNVQKIEDIFPEEKLLPLLKNTKFKTFDSSEIQKIEYENQTYNPFDKGFVGTIHAYPCIITIDKKENGNYEVRLAKDTGWIGGITYGGWDYVFEIPKLSFEEFEKGLKRAVADKNIVLYSVWSSGGTDKFYFKGTLEEAKKFAKAHGYTPKYEGDFDFDKQRFVNTKPLKIRSFFNESLPNWKNEKTLRIGTFTDSQIARGGVQRGTEGIQKLETVTEKKATGGNFDSEFYKDGGKVGGYTLEDFNPLLDEYDKVVSYKKIGKLEINQIVGKSQVEDKFLFKTEKDRDYWYEVLSKEQEKYFTVKNKRSYLEYILENNDPYLDRPSTVKKSEMLEYYADEIYYELRDNTSRNDFMQNLGFKKRFDKGGNFDSEFYKDGGSVGKQKYAYVQAETSKGEKVFKFFEEVPTHKEVYAYFRSVKDENGNPITLKDTTIHVEEVTDFDRDLFLEKCNEVALSTFGSPIKELDDMMFSFDKNNLSVFKFEAELENGTEVSIQTVDGVIVMEAEEEDEDKFKDGGSIDINFSTDTDYIKRENIKLVKYKNGKELYNWDYWDSYNVPAEKDELFSGLYVAKRPLPTKESEKQYSMFKKGGKLPKGAIYIKRSDIDSVIIYDEKLGDEIEIPANRIVNGIWFDNARTQMIIDRAKKEGLIPDKTKKTTTFIARFNGKKIELEAKSMFDAEQKAIKELKVPKSKRGLLSVMSKESYERGDFQFN